VVSVAALSASILECRENADVPQSEGHGKTVDRISEVELVPRLPWCLKREGKDGTRRRPVKPHRHPYSLQEVVMHRKPFEHPASDDPTSAGTLPIAPKKSFLVENSVKDLTKPDHQVETRKSFHCLNPGVDSGLDPAFELA